MRMYDLPDARGHFGPYGGVFVAETLTHALDGLRAAYESARADAAFQAEFHHELKHYRSEEHTSELQSLAYLVCRLLLEKKNNAHLVEDTTDNLQRHSGHKPRHARANRPN